MTFAQISCASSSPISRARSWRAFAKGIASYPYFVARSCAMRETSSSSQGVPLIGASMLGRDGRVKDDMFCMLPLPFRHLGLRRRTSLKATRCRHNAKEIARLREIEGAGDRVDSVGSADNSGWTAIAGHGENAHHAPSSPKPERSHH